MSDDIFRAASGQRAAAEGVTMPGVGTVLHRGGDWIQRGVVDEHERLHMELNGATSFGMLLSYVGQGGLGISELERTELLTALVEMSREAHEVYATTLAVSSLPDEVQEEVLTAYPGYRRHLDTGRSLVGGYPLDSMIAQALLVAACVAAMQVPLHLVVGEGEDWLSKPLNVAPAHCPTCRFRQVLEIAAGGLLDLSWIQDQVDPAWLRGRVVDPYGTPIYKQAYHLVLIRAYHQYAWALSERGIPVLPWDEHLRYGMVPVHSSLVRSGRFDREHLTPAEIQALEAATAAASSPLSPIRSSERQSLRRALYQGLVGVVAFADVLADLRPGVSIHTFVRRGAQDAALHVIVRPVEAVIESYATPESHAAMLRAAATDGVLTALRAIAQIEGSGELVTLLAVMRSNADLEALTRACIADRRVPPVLVSTISRSCLFSSGWGQEWLTGLRYVTHPVLLEDLPPSVFLEGHSDPDGLNFDVLKVEGPRREALGFDPLRGIAIERNRAAGTVERFLAILGSGILVENVAARVAELPRAKRSSAVASTPVGIAMRHLGIDEPEFHFRGYEYITPARIEEPAVDLSEFDRWHAMNQLLLAHQRTWRGDPGERL